MARRRRVRVAVGFGAGGRGALLASLVPTASEKADAERAKRAVDNAKIAAFNRDEISIEELTAYFGERKGQATTDMERTEIQAFIDNATAADKKKKSVKAYNAAAAALGDYKNGQGSYDDAITALKAAQSTVTDPEQRANITRLITSAGQIKTERVVNAAVEDYNAGRLTYDALRTTLSETHASETNEQIKTAVMKSLDQARDAENKKVMARATSDYNAGRGGIAEFSAALSALRDAPDQKNPDTIAQINAAMAAAQVNEQGIEDQKAYNRWVTKQADDATTMQYFNGRLAAEKNPKSLDHLGKYAGNIQQSIQANAERVAATARSVGSRAAGTADAQLKAQDAAVQKRIDEYDQNVFLKKFDKALASGDPYLMKSAYTEREKVLVSLVPSGGTLQGKETLLHQASTMKQAGIEMASVAELQRLTASTKSLIEIAEGLDKDKNASPLRRAEAWEKVGKENIRSDRSGWLVDPTQISFTLANRGTARDGVQRAINDLRTQVLEFGGDAGRQISGMYRDLLALDKGALSGGVLDAGGASKKMQALLKEAGITPEEALTEVGKTKFSEWLQENPEERVVKVLGITNAGKGVVTDKEGEQTNLTGFSASDKLAEEIIDNIRNAQRGIGSIDETTGKRGYGGEDMADMEWKKTLITNPDTIRYGGTASYFGGTDIRSAQQPMALPNPDGSYTRISDPTISAGEWWETRETRALMNAQGDVIDEGTESGKSGISAKSLIPPFKEIAGAIGAGYESVTSGVQQTSFRNIGNKMGDVGQFIGNAWEGFSYRDGRWVNQTTAEGIDAAAGPAMSPLEGTPGYVDYDLNAALGSWGGFNTPTVGNSDPFGGGSSSPEPYLREPVGLSPLEGTPGYVPDPYIPELPAFTSIDLPTTWNTSWDSGGNVITEA